MVTEDRRGVFPRPCDPQVIVAQSAHSGQLLTIGDVWVDRRRKRHVESRSLPSVDH